MKMSKVTLIGIMLVVIVMLTMPFSLALQMQKQAPLSSADIGSDSVSHPLREGWNHTYGGGDDDYGYAMDRTSDGGFILVGVTYSFSANARILLVKTDAYGNEEWSDNYGGSGFDYFGYDVQQTSDGGYIVAGYIDYITSETWLGILMKTDSTGTMEWLRYFAEADAIDRFYAVQQTSDGGYIMTGESWSIQEYGSWWPDVWVVKTDSLGYSEWAKKYGSVNFDAGYDIQLTSDGGYVVCGQRSYPYYAWVLKLNSAGTIIWNVTCNPGTYARSIKSTSDGGYIVTGDGLWMCKVTGTGGIEWCYDYGTGDGDEVYELSVGGYVMVGSSLVRVDAVGTEVFSDPVVGQDGVEIAQGYGAIVGTTGVSGNLDMILFTAPLDHEPPEMEIIKPIDGLYLGNFRLLKLNNLIILIGDMSIDVNATDVFPGVVYVEFYVDDVLMETQSGGSYSYQWNEKVIGRYTIRVTGYDFCGNSASDEITLFNIF